MKKALIIYHSKTGVTRAFGKEIGGFLGTLGVDATAYSIYDFIPDDAVHADVILLGCWTSGLFVLLQHPEQAWIDFSKRLPDLRGKKIGLFTTYKIATGSMFYKMQRCIPADPGDVVLRLKSSDGRLTDEMKSDLRRVVGTT